MPDLVDGNAVETSLSGLGWLKVLSCSRPASPDTTSWEISHSLHRIVIQDYRSNPDQTSKETDYFRGMLNKYGLLQLQPLYTPVFTLPKQNNPLNSKLLWNHLINTVNAYAYDLKNIHLVLFTQLQNCLQISLIVSPKDMAGMFQNLLLHTAKLKWSIMAIPDLIPVLCKPDFGCWKPVSNQFSVLLAFIEIYISSPIKSCNIPFLWRLYLTVWWKPL